MRAEGCGCEQVPSGDVVLTDAADQAVADCDQPVDDRLQVVHLERHVSQPQFVGHRGG